MSVRLLPRRAVGVACLLVFGLAASALAGSPPLAGADAIPPKSLAPDSLAGDRVARGKYLVGVFGCADCHTPHRPDGKLDLEFWMAGHRATDPTPTWSDSSWDAGVGMATAPAATAFAGPWGVTFARNLTPDPTTGLGGWNEEAFINVLREGMLKPPMPNLAYGQLSDEDLKSMFAYLQSLKPVINLVPFRQLAPPRLPGEVPGTKARKGH